MDDMTPADSSSHLATISHDGRFWEVYLDFEVDPARSDSQRGFLRFSPADGQPEDSVRTATILIEETGEQVVRKAKGMGDHMLVALLRSALPD